MKTLTWILILSVALFAATYAFAQQPQCGPMAEVTKELSGKYGEHPAWVGSDARGPVMLTMNPNSGSWSFLAIRNGLACFLEAGQDGQLVDLPAKGDPA